MKQKTENHRKRSQRGFFEKIDKVDQHNLLITGMKMTSLRSQILKE